MRARFVSAVFTSLFALLAWPAAANTLEFSVLVNTAPLIGHPAAPFSLDFQLNGSGANTVTIHSFDFGGGGAGGPAVGSGGANGNLMGGIALSDAANFFNELYQPFTPGNTLSFVVTMTTTVTPTPDAFSFAILNSNIVNIPTTGLGDSLVLVNVTTATLTLGDVQTFRGANPPGGPDYSGVTVLALPEPASLLLLGLGFVAAAGYLRRRKSAQQ